MATNIITCSIPIVLAQFLEENPELSPSKVLQSRLFEIREQEARLQDRLKANLIRIENISRKLGNVLRYAEEKKFAIPTNVLE